MTVVKRNFTLYCDRDNVVNGRAITGIEDEIENMLTSIGYPSGDADSTNPIQRALIAFRELIQNVTANYVGETVRIRISANQKNVFGSIRYAGRDTFDNANSARERTEFIEHSTPNKVYMSIRKKQAADALAGRDIHSNLGGFLATHYADLIKKRFYGDGAGQMEETETFFLIRRDSSKARDYVDASMPKTA